MTTPLYVTPHLLLIYLLMLNILALKRIEPQCMGVLRRAHSVLCLTQSPNGNLLLTACMQIYEKKFFIFFQVYEPYSYMQSPFAKLKYPSPLFKNGIFKQKKHPYIRLRNFLTSFLSACTTLF